MRGAVPRARSVAGPGAGDALAKFAPRRVARARCATRAAPREKEHNILPETRCTKMRTNFNELSIRLMTSRRDVADLYTVTQPLGLYSVVMIPSSLSRLSFFYISSRNVRSVGVSTYPGCGGVVDGGKSQYSNIHNTVKIMQHNRVMYAKRTHSSSRARGERRRVWQNI